jgi:hypothetical protein
VWVQAGRTGYESVLRGREEFLGKRLSGVRRCEGCMMLELCIKANKAYGRDRESDRGALEESTAKKK